MKKLKKRNLYWNLYWIESDGWEDCFAVARNSRSARCVEKDVNGFEDDDLNVTKVMRIPKNVECTEKLIECTNKISKASTIQF